MKLSPFLIASHAAASVTGAAMFIALPLIALDLGASTSGAAMLIGLGSYPALALAPWIASRADAKSRRALIRLGSALLILAGVLALGSTLIETWPLGLLVLSAISCSAALMCHGIGMFSAISELQLRREHRQAAGRLEGFGKAAGVAGMLSGGLLLTLGPSLAALGLCLLAAVSLSCSWLIPDALLPSRPTVRSPASAAREAWSIVCSASMRRHVIAGGAWVILLAPTNQSFLAPVLSSSGLSVLAVTAILVCGALIGAIAAFCVEPLAARLGTRSALALLAACAAVGCLLIASSGQLLILAVAVALTQVGSTSGLALLRAERHHRAPGDGKAAATVGNDLVMWTASAAGKSAGGAGVAFAGTMMFVALAPLLVAAGIVLRVALPRDEPDSSTQDLR